MSPERRFHRARLLSALAVAASAALVLVALAIAPGATYLPTTGSPDFDTEFIDWKVLQISWLLAPLLGIAAYFSVRVSLVGTACVAVSQFWAMAETLDRIQEWGYGDGLEVFGFLFPIGLTPLTLVLVLVGGVAGHRRRAPAQDQ